MTSYDDEAVDVTDSVESLLGAYGVLIVPPGRDPGGWLVSVARWNIESEHYEATGEGPLLETQEEAAAEAAKVLTWIQAAEPDDDLATMWERLQRARAAEERGDDRPRPWGRF